MDFGTSLYRYSGSVEASHFSRVLSDSEIQRLSTDEVRPEDLSGWCNTVILTPTDNTLKTYNPLNV